MDTMTLEAYQRQWAEDAKLPADELDEAARNVPLLHAKWWKFYTTERLKYKKLNFEYKTLYRYRWEWYNGKLDDEDRKRLGWEIQPLKVLSPNLSVYLDGDPLIQQAQAKLALAEETCRFLEDVIKSINNRGFQIKNSIEFLRFKMGV